MSIEDYYAAEFVARVELHLACAAAAMELQLLDLELSLDN